MPRKSELWFAPAAEIMVRKGVTLREALLELGVDKTTNEANNIERLKAFEAVLWIERNRYHQEIAKDPTRTRESLLGQLMVLAVRLAEVGAFDKAAEVLYKVARIEGWAAPEQQVSVVAGLSAKELEETKKKLQNILEQRDSLKRGEPNRPSIN